jgi:uncharacterized protein YcbX
VIHEGAVAELWRYPVKSFRGERLDELVVDERGVLGDRAFAVRDANGKLGSGKTTRRFRLLRGLLDFAARTGDAGVVVEGVDGTVFRVGDPALDVLLSERYGEPLAVLPEEAVPHFDVGPIHLVTTSSLGWVADGYGGTGGESRRYRPNLVLSVPGPGLVEEGWLGAEVAVGPCVLRVSGPAERCVMVNNARDELAADAGVLRFLVERNATNLGVYADVVETGTVRVGDPVRVSLPDA